MGRSIRWAGPIAIEGEMTGDGRIIEPGALRWEDLEGTSFRTVIVDEGEHKNAVNSGGIDLIERRSGGVIWGEGTVDLDSEIGNETARLIREKIQDGVSLDLDDTSYEIRVAQELMDEIDQLLTEPTEDEDADADLEVKQETTDDGYVVVAKINSTDEVMALVDARVRGLTLVSIPAFARARIALQEEEVVTDEPTPEVEPADALVAAAPPVAPPAAWFTDPGLEGPTPLVVTDAGEVYGHLAVWESCHVGHSSNGVCVPPPRSATNYAHFHTGYVVTDDGQEIAVGRLTMGTGHADTKRRLSVAEVLAHYDNTGTAAADIRVGEDRWGIWMHGALRPHMTAARIRDLRSSPASGDWRRVGTSSQMELVAALAVNVPGFGVLRPKGMISGGRQVALVASGVVPDFYDQPDTAEGLTEGDLRFLRLAAERERRQTRNKIAAFALRKRVRS